MARLLALAGLALLAVAEVGAVLALADAFGGSAALVILALDMLLGVWVIRWGARSAPPARGWRIGAGAFIALPGVVLDLVGLALLVPAVQGWVSGHLLRSTEAALRERGVSVVTVTDSSGATRTTVVPGDVIPGEVIDPDPGSPTDRAGEEPDPGPRIVRGEIAGNGD
ncbi:MAG: hypothetical protein WCF36_21130 [Candidatus Nanopelagicales bacterium]